MIPSPRSFPDNYLLQWKVVLLGLVILCGTWRVTTKFKRRASYTAMFVEGKMLNLQNYAVEIHPELRFNCPGKWWAKPKNRSVSTTISSTKMHFYRWLGTLMSSSCLANFHYANMASRFLPFLPAKWDMWGGTRVVRWEILSSKT